LFDKYKTVFCGYIHLYVSEYFDLLPTDKTFIQGNFFRLVFIRDGSDDALNHDYFVVDSAGEVFMLTSPKVVDKSFVTTLIDLLDMNEIPWRQMWSVADAMDSAVDLYYIYSSIEKDEETDKHLLISKVFVDCEGPELVRERLSNLIDETKSSQFVIDSD
jgi:hypothetical protein